MHGSVPSSSDARMRSRSLFRTSRFDLRVPFAAAVKSSDTFSYICLDIRVPFLSTFGVWAASFGLRGWGLQLAARELVPPKRVWLGEYHWIQ